MFFCAQRTYLNRTDLIGSFSLKYTGVTLTYLKVHTVFWYVSSVERKWPFSLYPWHVINLHLFEQDGKCLLVNEW